MTFCHVVNMLDEALVLVTLQICSFVCLLLEMCIWRSVYIVGNTTYILYIVIGNLMGTIFIAPY